MSSEELQTKKRDMRRKSANQQQSGQLERRAVAVAAGWQRSRPCSQRVAKTGPLGGKEIIFMAEENQDSSKAKDERAERARPGQAR